MIRLESKYFMIKGYFADYSSEFFTHDSELIYRLCDGKVVDILKIWMFIKPFKKGLNKHLC